MGDIFHFIDRIKVPIHHELKKAWKAALSRSFFIFDEKIMKIVTDALKKERNMSDKDIEKMLYYNTKFFCKRVPRVCPPSSVLYYRVRAVYDVYAHRVDSSGRPLLNEAAKKKFKNVLDEIIAGHASDPPGLSFYSPTYDKFGKMKTCSVSGVPILHCSRGSNLTENVHNQLLSLIGHRSMGIEMVDHLLREFRHRHNQNVAQVNRLNYPSFGHYDTWNIDLLQKLIIENLDGCRYYPHYNNIYDHVNTTEKFGIVPLHTDELLRKQLDHIRSRGIDFTNIKLSREMKYVAKCEGLDVPFVPVSSKEEMRLFNTLVLRLIDANGATIDFDAMALEWCNHVDGVTIFPKLPVYLRTYWPIFQHNSRVRLATTKVRTQADSLQKLHRATADGASVIFGEKPTLVSIIDGNAVRNSDEPFIVGQLNINANSHASTTSTNSIMKGPGRPPGSQNRTSTEPRKCKNCVFYNEHDLAITCPGKMTASRCNKPLHSSMTEYLAKDQPRKDKQKGKMMRLDDTPVSPQVTATNSNNITNDMTINNTA